MAHGPYINRAPDYADLNLDFFADPTTADVAILTGEAAIKRSVRNLVFTNFYERPFRSYIGGNVRALLFENADAMTAILVSDAVRDVVMNFEPRVQLDSQKGVVVTPDIDNNGFNVTLTYTILNRQLPLVQTLFLERIR